MWGKRSKEKIRWNPQGSPFAAWIGALLVLMALISVFVALGDIHFFGRELTPISQSKTSDDPVILTASEGHTYYWNQSGPFPIGKIRSHLAEFLKEEKHPRISITGDNRASLGDAVRLIDEVRRQGVKDVQIVTPVQPTR